MKFPLFVLTLLIILPSIFATERNSNKCAANLKHISGRIIKNNSVKLQNQNTAIPSNATKNNARP
jgi:hypothetical protein